jgi:uncharacterized membrane-anchored protein YhcB (DUF1043 family)
MTLEMFEFFLKQFSECAAIIASLCLIAGAILGFIFARLPPRDAKK